MPIFDYMIRLYNQDVSVRAAPAVEWRGSVEDSVRAGSAVEWRGSAEDSARVGSAAATDLARVGSATDSARVDSVAAANSAGAMVSTHMKVKNRLDHSHKLPLDNEI
jgi:hypothetical protein